MFKIKFVLFLLLIISYNTLFAQNDTIVAINKDIIVGEIKGMDKAVIKIKTAYSDVDFAIEWNKIIGLSTQSKFLVYTVKNERFDGKLKVNKEKKLLIINDDNKVIATLNLKDIVYLRTLKTKFWDKVSAELSLGYNYTKSNNFTQFTLRTTLGYEAKKWSTEVNYNSIASNRNDATSVNRLDADVSYRFFLRNGWFPLGEINWLSNTEQNINLRTVTRLGIGKFIIRNNSLYWGIQAGTSYNNESFTDTNSNTQNSFEGFFGTELNLYDIGDFSLLGKAIAYPGISEAGRWRVDGSVNLQYDLPFDFFIKFGVTVNYDNKSVVLNSKYDYIFHSTFGWSL